MSNKAREKRPASVSGLRYAAFLAVAVLLPFLLVAVVELGLRVARPDGGLALFEKAPDVRGDFLVATRDVGRRWFSGIDNAPGPPPEPFATIKPDRAFRVFVLGESSTAGFPYPRNATFSRFLLDVLRDVMPGDSVEVINLGIAATNSFAMLDIAREVAAQRPDAVIVYSGHNEYYGALGTASRVSIPGGSGAVRFYLQAIRLRTVLALRDLLAGVRGGGGSSGATNAEAASLMEILARDRQVPFNGPQYDQGVAQFEANLERVVRVFAERNVPVFVGSLVSNLRDQPPFAAEANARPGGARGVFESARAALAGGDSAAAAPLFAKARDLDVVRFRAPGEFNRVIQRVARSTGATYVPIAEAFAAASGGGVPGGELLLEHVHPNRAGYALMGRVFFESMLRSGKLGASADSARLRPWPEYAAGMTLTPFDERIALHTVRTLGARWPFVPAARQSDYRGSYRPVDALDSLAFDVSRGAQWEAAKLRMAAEYERRGRFDSAATEYAGLARDSPLFAEPLLLLARALGRAGRERDAEAATLRAVSIRPTPSALASLGMVAMKRRDLLQAAVYFRRSLALDPSQPDILYQLSLVQALSNDVAGARATALELARMQPDRPGLGELMASLGIGP